MNRVERRQRTAVLALVVLVHVVLWWALRPERGAARATTVDGPALQWVSLPSLPPPPAAPPAPPARPAALSAQRTTATSPAVPQLPNPHHLHPEEQAPTTLVAIPAATEPPASAASNPTGRLLDSAASRQALRRLGQQPLLSERAAQARGEDLQRSDGALAQEVARSAKGDCLKGEHAGGGMGLLSLPFLGYAAATGQCAR